MGKPKILVTNDDSIHAGGIKALVKSLMPLGKITVVAPKLPQSGMGHAITLNRPIRMKKVDFIEGVEAYECSGTPADCVKLAKSVIFKNKNPDLCVSGINHGSNASINVVYSGTMSAAMEAAIEGIPAVGFSLLSWDEAADMHASANIAYGLIKKILNADNGKNLLLNVNIPYMPLEDIKGVKVVRQADAKWVEEYEEREDPMGNKYYWLKGQFVNFDEGQDTDEFVLSNGYVSVVPIKFDLTAFEEMKDIKKIFD